MQWRPTLQHSDALKAIFAADPLRMSILALVQDCNLPQGWIAAGFVRDAVWDALHGREPSPPPGDIDIIWFDRENASAAHDAVLEHRFRSRMPDWRISVKNQARMHCRNGDSPYPTIGDAMRHWPETATAVAVRLCADGQMEINAPFGLDDLFTLRLIPGPRFRDAKRHIFDARVAAKGWRDRYPRLVCA